VNEIAPDIFWIETPAVNVYLGRDSDGLVLFDTGLPNNHLRFLKAIDELGCRPVDLKHIVLTHADYDHAGSLEAIQSATSATIYTGTATAALMTRGKSPKHMPSVVQFILDRFLSYKPVSQETIRIVADGEMLPLIGGLQAVATPGHTPDHFSFYHPATGVLFAGDALNTRDGRLQRTPKRITADQAAADRSARRLLELAPAIFACGHGPPLPGSEENIMALLNELPRNIL
jgi:glyoxylase-like metal-dependent hydrolase (beta-lactamase superfamily II)